MYSLLPVEKTCRVDWPAILPSLSLALEKLRDVGATQNAMPRAELALSSSLGRDSYGTTLVHCVRVVVLSLSHIIKLCPFEEKAILSRGVARF